MVLELCTDSLNGVLTAGNLNLNRVELCSALELGGLTPNIGLVKVCVDANCVEIHAMLRPRGGGFDYNSEELKMMEADLKAFAEIGVNGVVFGILNSDHTVSKENKKLVDLANSFHMEATFHRAFDLIKDKKAATNQLIDMGFTRILTSGGATRAIDGLEVIKDLQSAYGKQIQILAGSGINAENASIFKNAGIQQLHFTARKRLNTIDSFGFGSEFKVDEAKIKAIKQSLL